MKSIEDMFNLKGKTAIVTGAVGGIGSAIAWSFAELGTNVAFVDLDVSNIQLAKKEMEARFGVNTLAVPIDVSDRGKVEAGVNTIVNHFGHVDILVNCHGIGQWAPTEDINVNDWDRMMDVNLKGVFLMCQAVGRYMKEKNSGKIINIASMSGVIVNKPQLFVHYSVSKAGVIMLTKSLASEWAKYNINVNSVSPGYTLTPMVENLLKAQPEYSNYWKPQIPMGRLAKPSDIVGSVIFLSSKAADYITGHNLIVDGGCTIW
jgi:NAD(P)-dependent dehydrogenase (short-subunit alcohol dehydrogenase family)